jgi:hypothetical protein
LGISFAHAFIIASGVVGALLLVFGLILSILGSTIGIWIAVLGLTIIFAIIFYVAATNRIDETREVWFPMPLLHRRSHHT